MAKIGPAYFVDTFTMGEPTKIAAFICEDGDPEKIIGGAEAWVRALDDGTFEFGISVNPMERKIPG